MEKYKISVDVQTKYLDEQSNIDDDKFVFCYTITIYNDGDISAKLLSRHWQITNAEGKVREIEGKGVIGEQPHLHPGESFRYTSGAIIDTPVGSMQGSYEMLGDDGTSFLAEISPFSLAVPEMIH
jgi:ApaG protein